MTNFIVLSVLAMIFISIVFFASFLANLGNTFRQKKEDNIIYRFISFAPGKMITLVGAKVTYFRLCVVSLVVFLITVFGYYFSFSYFY
jgi:hypothetical protein